jgi:methylated-DNA-protein-cysteine methyltransferase-like protein
MSHMRIHPFYFSLTHSYCLSSDSRLVGQALKFLQAEDVPWQRVVSSSGAISDRGDGGEGANRQAERLREGKFREADLSVLCQPFSSLHSQCIVEGVEVSQSGTPAKFRVNMARYGWCE